MADKEIADLTAAGTLDGSELVHVSQDGDSRKATLTSIVALSTGAMLKATYDPNDDGVIAVAQGGTNAATASGARTNLGLGTMAVQGAGAVAITGGSVTGITDITVADGGTGASDASGARTNLGLVIGTDVQAYSANLAGFAATTVANVQNRVNHTGTQLAATISDFSTASDLRIAAAVDVTVQAYSATLDDWSAIDTADKLDASVIPAAEDGKILSWTGTSLVNKTAGDLGTFVVGEDVQAYSANLDDWSALATSAKQDASANLTAWSALATSAKQDADANLTTLAAVTPGSTTPDSDAGDIVFPAYLSILSSAKGGNIDMALMKQSGAWLDLSGADGSEAVTDAAWADAYDAAEQWRSVANKGAIIELPAGCLRIDTTMKIDTALIRARGQGHGSTVITTDKFDIDMAAVEGASGAGNTITGSDFSRLSLIRVGTMTTATISSPKQLAIRNANNGRFDDIYIQKAMVGVYLDRAYDNMFPQLYINGISNDVEGYAAVHHTSTIGRVGTSFSNYFEQFEINYKKAGVDAGFTHGFIVNCADGLYIRHGHILDARYNISLWPTDITTITDKLGGVFVDSVYIDRATVNNLWMLGAASSAYGRIRFSDCRFSLAGVNGVRIENTSAWSGLEFDNCLFFQAGEKGFYAVSGGSLLGTGLKLTNSKFMQNNTTASASGGDLILNRLDDYTITGNSGIDGNAAGTGISVGTTMGPGTIVDNDWSASTAGTKLSIAGSDNGRKITGNREVKTGFSEIEREGVQQTTDATSTNVLSIAVAENQTVVVEFEARASHASKGNAASIKKVAVYSRATAGSLVEEGEGVVWEVEDAAGQNITLAAVSNNIQANVIGIAATTFNWHWTVKYRVRTA